MKSCAIACRRYDRKGLGRIKTASGMKSCAIEGHLAGHSWNQETYQNRKRYEVLRNRDMQRDPKMSKKRIKTASGMKSCAIAYAGNLDIMRTQKHVAENVQIFGFIRAFVSKNFSNCFQKTSLNRTAAPISNFGKPSSEIA